MQVSNIYYGNRGQAFVDLIKGFLKKGNLNENYINKITTPECMRMYSIAFTNASASEKTNYEYLEMLGDAPLNMSTVLYMDSRFPEIRCPGGVEVIGRLKINYVSKQSFYLMAKELGFWPFITASQQTRQTAMKSLLEDCFESVYGTTTLLLNQKIKNNVGFAIVPDIVGNILKDTEISLNYYDLYDSKTILKQLYDKRKDLGELKYSHPRQMKANPRDEYYYVYVQVIVVMPNGSSFVLAEGTGSKKDSAEQNAAKNALNNLKNQGIYPEIPQGFLGCKVEEQNTEAVEMYQGERGEAFIEMLRDFLKRGKLKNNVIDILTAPDTMDVWDKVFTHISASTTDNNKYMRFIGQTVVNSLLVWYFNNKFPQIQCPQGVEIMARLKIVYASKQTFVPFAKEMNLLPFITSTVGTRRDNTDTMLFWCLEAMFGALVILFNNKIKKNSALCIIPDIIANLYDTINISLDYYDLNNTKTILKQLCDKRKDLGKPEYTYEARKDNPDDDSTYAYVRLTLNKYSSVEVIGEGTGTTKALAEQAAAKTGLVHLAHIGISPDIPKDYLMFCDME